MLLKIKRIVLSWTLFWIATILTIVSEFKLQFNDHVWEFNLQSLGILMMAIILSVTLFEIKCIKNKQGETNE